MANSKDREVEICKVLRALKQRFTRRSEAAQRREVVIEYSRADVCGMNEENYIVQKKLLFDGGEKIKVYPSPHSASTSDSWKSSPRTSSDCSTSHVPRN
jgi:hypothetical protein